MSNSIKIIIAAIDFMITCPLDHLRGHLDCIKNTYWEYPLPPALSIVTQFVENIWPL